VPTFLVGSFTDFSFAAQVVSELFAVTMWWTIANWIERREIGWLLLAGVAGTAAFLTWPVIVGPPLALLGLAVLLPDRAGIRGRALRALLTIVPVAVVAVLFALGRTDMAVIVGTGGTTGQPTVAAYGMPFLVLSSAGLLAAAFIPQTRAIAGFALVIALQAAALWAFAAWHGNTPYMALKMAYLALSAQAAGIAVAMGLLWALVQRIHIRRMDLADYAVPAAWIAVAVTLVVAGRSWAERPKPAHGPAMSRSLEDAGLWARANVPAGCVEYLVRDPDTAYWLHLAVLRNPRMSARTGDDSTYELNASLIRWLSPDGRPYAIADLNAVPRDVGAELDVVQAFGPAVVARRRGPARCDEAP
jgi:hypothetical protein